MGSSDPANAIDSVSEVDPLSLAELERQQIGYELHDGLIQHLIGARMLLEIFRDKAKQQKSITEAEIGQIEHLVNEAIREGRQLLGDLYPELVQQAEDLQKRIEELVEQMATRAPQITWRVICEKSWPRFHAKLGAAVFRLVQECLSNAWKHSNAHEVIVTLGAIDPAEDSFQVQVIDDGRGFDPNQKKAGHYGMKSLQFRTSLLKGSLNIESAPGQGTTIGFKLPVSLAAT